MLPLEFLLSRQSVQGKFKELIPNQKEMEIGFKKILDLSSKSEKVDTDIVVGNKPHKIVVFAEEASMSNKIRLKATLYLGDKVYKSLTILLEPNGSIIDSSIDNW